MHPRVLTEDRLSENRIAIVGPGAVGGLLAALLERAGVDVVAVARPETTRAINEHGLTIRSQLFGDWTSRPEARSDIPSGARIVVATKAFAVPQVAASIGEAHPAEVISLLNGMEHMALLRASVRGAPVAGSTIAVEALRASATVCNSSREVGAGMGAFPTRDSSRCRKVCARHTHFRRVHAASPARSEPRTASCHPRACNADRDALGSLRSLARA
ncbi:MAG TPA: 2-dehydropantoate 2-reductase [Lacisediminihabitans sp.]|nr:2-dehydropantoate 2-reductase [Lacisediminihabitans sp.]HXD61547.1 2-dehydropantoate 2-reductase [Lacisediminihabitans sp.]